MGRASAARRLLEMPGARHSVDWYDQRGEEIVLAAGDRMFVPCVGGPAMSRLEAFPPRLEVAEDTGTYVLVDIGPRAAWVYEFVPADRVP